MDTFPLSLVCIVWFISQTWQYKPFQIYLWFFTLRVFYIVYMHISAIVPINIWNYQIDKNHGNKGQQNIAKPQNYLDIHDHFHQTCVI